MMLEMTEQMIDPVRRDMVGNEKISLVRASCLALLSICLVGYLFTGAPPVNAQEEEYNVLLERIARMEGILEQINERLMELNHLGERIDGLSTEINSLNTNLGDRIDGVRSDIGSWNTNLLYAFFGSIIISPVVNAYSRRYIDRRD